MCVRGRKHTARGPPPPNCLRSRCQGHDRKLDQGPGPDEEEVPVSANVQEASQNAPQPDVEENAVATALGENAQNTETVLNAIQKPEHTIKNSFKNRAVGRPPGDPDLTICPQFES